MKNIGKRSTLIPVLAFILCYIAVSLNRAVPRFLIQHPNKGTIIYLFYQELDKNRFLKTIVDIIGIEGRHWKNNFFCCWDRASGCT